MNSSSEVTSALAALAALSAFVPEPKNAAARAARDAYRAQSPTDAQITARVGDVKYDRGCGSEYYFGRRQFCTVMCSDGIERSDGMADGKIVKEGWTLRMSTYGYPTDVKFVL